MVKRSLALGNKQFRATGFLLCLSSLLCAFSLLSAPNATLMAQQAQPTALPEEEPVSTSAETEDISESAPEFTFDGIWHTHIATLDLVQDGTQVTGTIVGYGGNWDFPIAGDVTGNVLVIAASEVTEAFTLTLSDDGEEIRGAPEDPMQWCGGREPVLIQGCGFSGIWSIYSDDYTVPPGSYLQLVQTQDVVTGTLYSLEQTQLQPVSATVEWAKGYSLQVADAETFGNLTWLQDGKAFGISPNEQAYELQINRANSIGPFFPSAYNPAPASTVDREDAPLLLPAPLYFLNAEGQIMHLDPEQFEATQLTNEAGPISSFDVAGTHGGLTYIFDQQLIEMDIVSKARTILVDARVSADDEAVDEAELQNQQIDNPRYSPDGQQIVYVHEGIWLIDSLVGTIQADGTDDAQPSAPIKLADNVPFDTEAGNVGETRRYFDAIWSPSGRYLLTSATRWEGSSSDILDVSTGASIFDEDFWLPCCRPTWGSSDDTVVVASTALAYGQPGLYRVDVPNGTVNTIFDGVANQSNLLMMAQSGHETQSGEIHALLSQMDMNFPGSFMAEAPFVLHKVSDTGDVTPLNSGGIAPRELLWAEDDSGLLMSAQDGTLGWVPANGDSVTSLFIVGSNLRWGASSPAIDATLSSYLTEEFPLQSYPERGLAKKVAEDLGLGFSAEQASGSISVQYLAPPAELSTGAAGSAGPLWVAHSTQQRNFDQELGHWVALYMQQDGAWEQVELLQFPITIDEEVESGPDYVGPNSLRTAALSTDRYWLSLEGGVGAHSSRYFLLSFDGTELAIEASGFSSAGGAGRLEGVNADGLAEYLVLDASDYYVFCYACGVRRVQYNLLRWDGRAMVPVELTLLDEEAASISPELGELNNRAVALAQAGLWNEVQEIMAGYYDLSQEGLTNQQSDDNFAFIRIHLGDIQQAVFGQDQPYPLLSQIFYGDYATAYGLLQETPAEDIFNANSPLIVGTPADGWQESLAQNILISTESALAYAPDRAEIHFFSGWANWLLGNNQEAADALAAAAALAPEDVMIQQSWEIVQDSAAEIASSAGSSGTSDAESNEAESNETESDTAADTATEATSSVVIDTSTAITLDTSSEIEALDLVNLRSGPSIESSLIGAIESGERAPLLGRSEDGLWWLISTEALALDAADGETPLTQAWISANPEYTAEISDELEAAPEASEIAPETGAQLEALDLMNLRGGPGVEYDLVGAMEKGARVPVLGKSEDERWWLISAETLELEPIEGETPGQTQPVTEAWISANIEYTEVDDPILVPIVRPGEPSSSESEAEPEAEPEAETPSDDSADNSEDNSVAPTESAAGESTPAIIAQLDAAAASLAFSPDEALFATAGNQGLRVWDTATWTIRWQELDVPAATSGTQILAFSPDGSRLLIGRADGAARLFEAATGTLIATFTFGQSVQAVGFNADGLLVAAGSSDGKAIVAEAATGTILAELQNDLPIRDMALSPSGPWVAVMTAGPSVSADLVIWDFLTSESRSLSSHNELPNSSNVVFSPDTGWVAGSLKFGGPIGIWQTQTWPEVATIDATSGIVRQLVFSPNGGQLAGLVTGPDGHVLIMWNTSSWAEVARMILPDTAWDLAYSPDSSQLVIGLGQDAASEAQLRNAQTGSLIARLPHTGQVTEVAFSPGGRWIAAGGASSVNIWSTEILSQP